MAEIKMHDCKVCCNSFKPAWSKAVAKYCSRSCASVGRITIAERDCLVCGVSFRPKSLSKVGKYCSQQCKKRKFILRDGYKAVHVPQHKESGPQGYVLEHRMIMDDLMSGGLTSDLVIHHIDEDKHNNHVNNLMALSRMAHATLHQYE